MFVCLSFIYILVRPISLFISRDKSSRYLDAFELMTFYLRSTHQGLFNNSVQVPIQCNCTSPDCSMIVQCDVQLIIQTYRFFDDVVFSFFQFLCSLIKFTLQTLKLPFLGVFSFTEKLKYKISII